MSKTRKIKPAKKEKLSSFVAAISDITGYTDGLIKTRSGYIGMLRVPGTDIVNYQEGDQEVAYRGFGSALQNSTTSVKMVFMDISPNLEEQKKYFTYQLERTQHPYRKELLMRQITYMENLEQEQKERMAYLLFFHADSKEIYRSMDIYRNYMKDVQLCSIAEMTEVIKNLLGAE